MKNLMIYILCLITFLLNAQEKMTSEKLWELGRVKIDVISDDGKIIFGSTQFNIQTNNSYRNLYLLDLDGKTTQLTRTKSREQALFFIDNHTFIYTKDNKTYSFNIKDLTSKEFLNTQLNGLKINKNYVSFTKKVKEEKVLASDYYPSLKKSNVKIYNDLMYRHWDTWKDGLFSHVFISTDLKTHHNAFDITPNEPYNITSIEWSPNEQELIYVAKKEQGKKAAQSTNTDLYLYNPSTKKTINLTSNNKGYDTSPKFNDEGTLIAYLQMKTAGYEADKNDIILIDKQDLNKSVNLTKNWDYTVSDFIWGKDSNTLYFLAAIQATYQLFELKIDTKKIRQITTGNHNYTSIHLVNNYLVGGRQDMNRATEIYKVAISSGKQTQLSHINDKAYAKIAKSTIEKRWIDTTDGQKMLTWVIYPPDFDSKKKYPTLLYCQGGPQSAVSQFYSFRWNFQLMAAQGYIVVAPNRRGLPSFGTDWNHAISKDWGGQPMQDYFTAIDTLAKEPYVDENRLGSVGASYGGYSVYMLAGIHNKRFKTFISHCGLFNMTSWYGVTEELFFANYDLGGAYWDKKAAKTYQDFNPINFVDKWDTPMMVIHGGKDYRVPENQGMEAFTAAQLKGLKSRFLYFPEENHWVLTPQNGLVWQHEFFKWLKETL